MSKAIWYSWGESSGYEQLMKEAAVQEPVLVQESAKAPKRVHLSVDCRCTRRPAHGIL